jgi:hypothetical protein
MSATAERLARHLETNYGLQLDEYRRRALVEEIDLFAFSSQAPIVIRPISKRVPSSPKKEKH